MANGKEASGGVRGSEIIEAPEEAGNDVPALPEAACDAIALKLRATYGELVNAPIPDRFAKLLDDLSKAHKGE